MSEQFDLLVIGGGINGAGIARDAAGRGLSVCLVEKDDLAQHTSSASTKLVHGGLRYLEHFEFRLVRESLIERERLLKIAPHIIWPLRFVLPHDDGLRPKWMLRLGLFLYDNLGGRKLLPPTRTVDLRAAPHGKVLEERLVKGFEYSDCWVEDSRLVALNCLDAKEHGADIRTRTECVGLERQADGWSAELRSESGEVQIHARMVVNAAGPWVDKVLGRAIPSDSHENLRLVKGSHLIFPRLFEGEHCYIFQNKDERIIFAIPYERDFTLVGTTDVGFEGDPSGIQISAAEAHYICDAANEYLEVDIAPEQAVSSYAGVRPLYDDSSASNSTVTRDYVFELDRGSDNNAPPMLSIFGGKITTYRKLAEHALEKLGVSGNSWTADKHLPGGNIDPEHFDDFVAETARRYPWLPESAVARMARAYGTRIDTLIGTAQGLNDMGPHLGGDLYARELEYLAEHEFVTTAEDALWRRSKLELHLDDASKARVRDWFAQRKVAA
ncbi:glycerol-3-phosphate dehydrogenase [uncultured Erythrobacter sp.]|uniref:glycerol-3-phosphate dehydrogenase n=1 Tax=uncultured Erythrobacter sp. TaxID=263913 RepID=UPI00262AB5A4|nr:glycerol-3-phosphate dehydrogenase [uncultured Erythrobacter sp.]